MIMKELEERINRFDVFHANVMCIAPNTCWYQRAVIFVRPDL